VKREPGIEWFYNDCLKCINVLALCVETKCYGAVNMTW